MTESLRLSIIIVSYNDVESLLKCLKSIEVYAAHIPHEICVIDNASQDESVAGVEKDFPHAKVIVNRRNLGFSKAINQGLFETSAPYVLWMNPDAEFANDRLGELLDYLDSNKEIAVLGPEIKNTDGTVQLSARSFPSYEHYFFGRYSLMTKWFPNNAVSKKYLQTDTGYDKIKDVDWVSGACFLHRRALIHEVGLLDEGFFMYFEEVDFCRRVKRTGLRIQYYPKAFEIIHRIGGSSQQTPVKMLIVRNQSNWRYYTKYFVRNPIKDGVVALGLIARCCVQIILSKLKFKVHEGS